MKTSCSFFKKKFNIPASVSMVPRVIGLTTRVPKILLSAISILFVPSNAVPTKKKLLALLSLSWREVPYHVPLRAKFSRFSPANCIAKLATSEIELIIITKVRFLHRERAVSVNKIFNF